MSATERLLAAALALSCASPATSSPAPGGPPDPPAPHAPRIDALPQPAAREALDLEALARGFASQASATPALANGEAQLLVFISLAMPDATLARLVDQAARVPARIVLRGLSENSLVRTAARVQQLIGQRPVAIQIDPLEFDRYAVRQVPAFVLARSERTGGCASGQCAGAGFAVVAGDVSLAYALRQIRDRAPGLRRDASRLLARLEP